MSNELDTHKRKVETENRSMRVWDADEKFDEVRRLCGIVQSHMVSAGEAAWRQDERLLTDHLRHAREGLILALKVWGGKI